MLKKGKIRPSASFCTEKEPILQFPMTQKDPPELLLGLSGNEKRDTAENSAASPLIFTHQDYLLICLACSFVLPIHQHYETITTACSGWNILLVYIRMLF